MGLLLGVIMKKVLVFLLNTVIFSLSGAEYKAAIEALRAAERSGADQVIRSNRCFENLHTFINLEALDKMLKASPSSFMPEEFKEDRVNVRFPFIQDAYISLFIPDDGFCDYTQGFIAFFETLQKIKNNEYPLDRLKKRCLNLADGRKIPLANMDKVKQWLQEQETQQGTAVPLQAQEFAAAQPTATMESATTFDPKLVEFVRLQLAPTHQKELEEAQLKIKELKTQYQKLIESPTAKHIQQRTIKVQTLAAHILKLQTEAGNNSTQEEILKKEAAEYSHKIAQLTEALEMLNRRIFELQQQMTLLPPIQSFIDSSRELSQENCRLENERVTIEEYIKSKQPHINLLQLKLDRCYNQLGHYQERLASILRHQQRMADLQILYSNTATIKEMNNQLAQANLYLLTKIQAHAQLQQLNEQ